MLSPSNTAKWCPDSEEGSDSQQYSQKIHYSNTPAQKSLSGGNRLKHQRVSLAEVTPAGSFEMLTKRQAKGAGRGEVKELSPLTRDLHPELLCLLVHSKRDNFVSSANCISSTYLMSSAKKGRGRLYSQEQEQTYTTYLPSSSRNEASLQLSLSRSLPSLPVVPLIKLDLSQEGMKATEIAVSSQCARPLEGSKSWGLLTEAHMPHPPQPNDRSRTLLFSLPMLVS